MGMAAMVALTPHMKVKMLMGGRPGIVAMLMGVQLQTEGGANGKDTDHQQGDTHKKLSPRGHRLHMDEVLEPDRNKGKDDHPERVTGTPCQTRPQGSHRLTQ